MDARLLRKPREKVFIVGAGTWQDLWQGSLAGGIGFGRQHQSPDVVERIRRAPIIPPELLNRFNPNWVILEPYTATDFEDIAAGLKVSPGIVDPLAAAESGLNFRAIEAALTTRALHQLETAEY